MNINFYKIATQGRLNRTSFIAYLFLAYLFVILLTLLFQLFPKTVSDVGIFIVYIFYSLMTILLAIRRAHDFNERGWYAFIFFIPLFNLIFFFRSGTPESNNFGVQKLENSNFIKSTFAISIIFFLIFLSYPFRDESKDIWHFQCDSTMHLTLIHSYANFGDCAKVLLAHYDENEEEISTDNKSHIARCKHIDAAFPWNLVTLATRFTY